MLANFTEGRERCNCRVNVTIENNLFSGNVGPAVENWASYDGASVRVSKNSFLSSDYYALSLRAGYTSSALDALEGVGPKRKKLLIRYFGSVEQIKRASTIDLINVPGLGKKTAASIYNQLN